MNLIDFKTRLFYHILLVLIAAFFFQIKKFPNVCAFANNTKQKFTGDYFLFQLIRWNLMQADNILFCFRMLDNSANPIIFVQF